MKSVREVIQERRDWAAAHAGPRPVADWQDQTPAGSRWFPGALGRPDCPMCRGTGYQRLDLPIGHPDFGRLLLCDCAVQDLASQEAYRRAAQLSHVAGLGEQALSRRWDGIVPHVNTVLDDAVKAVREVLGRGWGWVYLWGPPGTGKTMLLQTAVAESAAGGIAAAYVELPDMLGSLRSAYAQNAHEERLQDWRDVPVLALDELGRANDTAWADEVEHRILGHRYMRSLQERKGISLFAANFAPDHLGPALSSRVGDKRCYVFHITGQDVRKAL